MYFYKNLGTDEGNDEGVLNSLVDDKTNQQDDLDHNTLYKIIRQDTQEEGFDILEKIKRKIEKNRQNAGNKTKENSGSHSNSHQPSSSSPLDSQEANQDSKDADNSSGDRKL